MLLYSALTSSEGKFKARFPKFLMFVVFWSSSSPIKIQVLILIPLGSLLLYVAWTTEDLATEAKVGDTEDILLLDVT